MRLPRSLVERIRTEGIRLAMRPEGTLRIRTTDGHQPDDGLVAELRDHRPALGTLIKLSRMYRNDPRTFTVIAYLCREFSAEIISIEEGAT